MDSIASNPFEDSAITTILVVIYLKSVNIPRKVNSKQLEPKKYVENR